MPEWLQNLPASLSDPLVRRIVWAAAGIIVLVIVLRIIRRVRYRLANARLRATLARERDEMHQQQAEAHRLAERILATSSTARIAGYAIVRQVETLITEARPSSAGAMELLKATAARKGANALINVQTQQTAGGKWVANGDAVVVKLIPRRGEKGG